MRALRLQAMVLPVMITMTGFAVVLPSSKPSPAKGPISYNRDVRPILSETCFKCHGPSAKEGKGGLRLDDVLSALKDRRGFRALIPHDPKNSRVMVRILAKDDDDAMPPKDSGVPRLTDAQISVLRQWIEEGAKYEKHWALVPPKSPAIPSVKDSKWVKNPIDSFVLAKLESAGLKPEPEADKHTLLRRVALTLTGLQPTPSEQAAYLADSKPGAYERMVDRYLNSTAYGEHQARFWLDAVRYGDTHGLHLDNERAIYPYRDWVVRAFNSDLPYDQFATWQLAGDLLPNPSVEQLIATGYIRMNPTTNEGGAIAEEFQAKNTFDRVDTTSTVFLGMTIACARCHNHKYDPITQEDYYRLFAFFNSTADEPLDGNLLTPGPAMKAPLPDENQKLQLMAGKLRAIEATVGDNLATSWAETRRIVMPQLGAWEVSEQVLAETFDKAFDAESVPEKWSPIAIKLDENQAFFTKENCYAYLRTTLNAEKSQSIGIRLASDDGIRVWLNGKLVLSNKDLRGLAEGVDNLRIDLQQGKNDLLIKIVNATGPGGVRIGFGDDIDKSIDEAVKSKNLQAIKSAYLMYGPDDPASIDYRAQSKAYNDYLATIPETLVAKELPQPRPAFVLRRGEYNLPTEKVERQIPATFGALPAKAAANRLGLAQWLVTKKNPLFARVFVNRLWQQHFGTGIVKTAEDFGNQGEWPSHPELLDYLSVQFEKYNFSIKKLHKLILTSASFKQRSSVDADKHKLDPENRLISRGPRFRLDAEVLRDQVLYASGLLIQKPGGKGFRPYQPAGLWEEVAFQGSTTSTYTQDMTAEIYRRSLYLFWKRTSPHPVMMTFDAPMREMCVVRRARTNTPLQALVTLNEPAFLESSRVFAQRLINSKGDDASKVETAFQWALGRNPSELESKIFANSLARYRSRYATEQKQAESLVSVGLAPVDKTIPATELASWTLVCSTLFNLDEFLTQH